MKFKLKSEKPFKDAGMHLRFCLRIMRFNPSVKHISGKSNCTAGAPACAPVDKPANADEVFIDEVEDFASSAVAHLPAPDHRIKSIREAQKADEETSTIMGLFNLGILKPDGLCGPRRTQDWWLALSLQWPAPSHFEASTLTTRPPPLLRHKHFTVIGGLLLFDDRLVIPRPLRLEIFEKLHERHLGTVIPR
ncbi:hypothetical protein CAPTEDRAFT_214600 [Capitella teleta]|uniref:Uncharacterized protein n=1 Tax=Capitella teleta TaxID=283909 RepID=R7UI97_CAPTE|nr:hypothetical protein CAPTEDRAFT_214600 [Capitella teleta]|eukprot:ELU06289.1 hypothetical protein CAPTEDRAFT_214600 [Capitella teleta]